MTHGKKMEIYGRILALQETMLHVQTKIGKLNEQVADTLCLFKIDLAMFSPEIARPIIPFGK